MKNLFSLFEIADIIDSDYLVLQWFSNLCRSGVGQKIKEWQKKVREEISKLPKEKQDQMLKLFSDCLVNRDKKTLPKMAERIPDFNKDEWIDARRVLWTERVYKRFGVSPHTHQNTTVNRRRSGVAPRYETFEMSCGLVKNPKKDCDFKRFGSGYNPEPAIGREEIRFG